VIAGHGRFCELYTDRGSHYFVTPKAGEPVSKTMRTQVGRALAQLGIRHIAAYSAEARGRSERAFRTLQDRLLKELRLAGITTLTAANRWIAEVYLPAHNAAFAVAPAEAGSAFVADRAGQAREVLCLLEERRVGNDNTVKWGGRSLQIPPSRLRPHFVRAMVRVHEYPDGGLTQLMRYKTGQLAASATASGSTSSCSAACARHNDATPIDPLGREINGFEIANDCRSPLIPSWSNGSTVRIPVRLPWSIRLSAYSQS
jgi:hypothetical protein